MPMHSILGAGYVLLGLWTGGEAYGVQGTPLGAIGERWNVVGVISEESPQRPLGGVVVLRHKLTKETHTLTVGDPLPGDPTISIVSTKPGRVKVSDGQKEVTLEGVDADPAVDSDVTPTDDAPLAKKSLIGASALDSGAVFPTWTGTGREDSMVPKGIFERPVSSLTDEAFRFPYLKAERSLRPTSEGVSAEASDPYLGLESFSQVFEKSMIERDDSAGGDDPDREETGPLPSPWWSGEEWDLSDATP